MNCRFAQTGLPRQAIALLMAYALVLGAVLGSVGSVRSGAIAEICFGSPGAGRSDKPAPVKHHASGECCLALCGAAGIAIIPATAEIASPSGFPSLTVAIERSAQSEPPAKFVSARAPPPTA